ncbi:MAG TPA: dUTP diphosphatase, partial [Gammaproteobacteria bacterium]
GKNVLNFFRQDHGYKEGSYVKQWHGREDNEHLSELLSQLDSGSADFREQVYRGLEQRYPG